jgi:hypothetical protein
MRASLHFHACLHIVSVLSLAIHYAVLCCRDVLCSFAGAYDWANTSETAFAPVVYFNDTFSMPDDGSDVGSKYTRKPQLLNMAVNSWMSTVLGRPASKAKRLCSMSVFSAALSACVP